MEAGMENHGEGVPAAVAEVKQRAASGAESLKESAKARAERLGAGVGEHAGNIAQAVRTAGESMRGKEDWLADAADGLSRNLERFSAAAREKGFDSVKQDVERVARERPVLFIGAAVTAGLALGRLLRSTQRGPEGAEQSRQFDPAVAGTGEASGYAGGSRQFDQQAVSGTSEPGYAGATSEPGASRRPGGPTTHPDFASTQPQGERYGSE